MPELLTALVTKREQPASFAGTSEHEPIPVPQAASGAGEYIDRVLALPRLWGHPDRALPAPLSGKELERLATGDQGRLIRLGERERGAVVLSEIAEAFAHASELEEASIAFLLTLCEHPRPFVRESAIYGLAPFLGRVPPALARVEKMSRDDLSPGVRESAAEVLMLL